MEPTLSPARDPNQPPPSRANGSVSDPGLVAPVIASPEEISHARELREQIRKKYLNRPDQPCSVWWVGPVSPPSLQKLIDNVSITGTRSELGRILARWHAPSAAENVYINLAGQQANSLLHDGHAWKDFARTTLAGTRRAMRSARRGGRADACPRELRLRACGRARRSPEGAAALVGRCDPRMRSAGRCRVRCPPASCASVFVRPGER